jgi:hypothetical protein
VLTEDCAITTSGVLFKVFLCFSGFSGGVFSGCFRGVLGVPERRVRVCGGTHAHLNVEMAGTCVQCHGGGSRRCRQASNYLVHRAFSVICTFLLSPRSGVVFRG